MKLLQKAVRVEKIKCNQMPIRTRMFCLNISNGISRSILCSALLRNKKRLQNLSFKGTEMTCCEEVIVDTISKFGAFRKN